MQSPTATLIPLFSSSELTGCRYPGLLDRKNRSDMCPRWESNPRLPACKVSTLSTRPGSPQFQFPTTVAIYLSLSLALIGRRSTYLHLKTLCRFCWVFFKQRLSLSKSVSVIGKPQTGNISAAYASVPSIMFPKNIRYNPFEKNVEEDG